MKKPLKTVLAGAGGYGETYVEALLNGDLSEYFDLVAIADPYAQNSRLYARFKDTVPVYERLEDFFAVASADLAIISSPIRFHYEQCAAALDNGANVLCEKPLVPTLAQFDSLDKKIQESGKILSVGFQWCYSEAMLGLKERILSGEFGKAICLKCFVSWPRDRAYYARGGGWAGKIKAPDGGPINDSVASNATAHYIQNMLFLLGGSMEESAYLRSVSAECCRANEIESFDTVAFRGEANGAEVFYAASHAVNYQVNPVMYYEFEKATVTVNVFEQDYLCRVHHRGGKIENLGAAIAGGDKNKLLHMARRILGEQVFICTEKTAKPFTVFIDALFSRVPFYTFDDGFIVKEEDPARVYVKNLHLDLARCFELCKLPSELALPWAKPPAMV